ncbi:sulfotransferase family protein [Trichlorobacter lovleyi]|uniref:Sulfotransferase n=1 Tax=Trichlorobacter lovleyi (strain ATCC BAA-1151 / DSM 17278 / SZ) TaxID=398767 RepID=B3E8W7_TRIL1|nr:sulfotransferase [Trichlorobacter lovleyi]ACD95235.1 conserved hypothetical protein [Trichlorobacter lovleyi SZ]
MNIKDYAPVFIGGVGGSGTRVVTEILKKSGFFMGNNLNTSNDYLEFSRLGAGLRQLMQLYGSKTNTEIYSYIFEKLDEITALMQTELLMSGCKYKGWGWKTPPNFMILEELEKYYGNIKYIHIIRDGLDMAYSSNLNQMKLWGFYFGINLESGLTPQTALKYWLAANKYAIELGHNLLRDRFYLISFEQLCCEKEKVIRDLLKFIEVEPLDISDLSGLITPPETIGRCQQYSSDVFDNNDLEELQKIRHLLLESPIK